MPIIKNENGNIHTEGAIFNPGVSQTLCSDDDMIIKWDGINKQPLFRPGITGWWDSSIFKIDGGSSVSRSSSDDILIVAATDYYFTPGGLYASAYDFEEFAANATCTLSKEGDITAAVYILEVGIGDVDNGWWKLTKISP